MSVQFQPKSAVSVSEMAALVGLSRQRFYQLVGSVFPFPIYSVATRRPFYNQDLQQVCLSVRQSNCGIDGKPVLFYAQTNRKADKPSRPSRTTTPPPKETSEKQYPDILAAIRVLGMPSVSSEQITAAVQSVFPSGINGMDQGKVIRAIFLHMKRQNHGDTVDPK